MDNNVTQDYIDVIGLCSQFFRHFFIFWPFILLLSLIMTGIFSGLGRKLSKTTYSSQITFSYGIKTADATDFDYTLADIGDIKQFSRTFESILYTDIFEDALLKELGKEYLSTSLGISFTKATNYGILTSESSDKDEAVEVLTAALKVLPDVMLPVTGPVEIRAQNSPGKVKEAAGGFPVILFAVGGFVAGMFLGMGLLVLFIYVRRELSTEQAINSSLSLKVIGTLPFLKEKGSVPFLNALKLYGFLPTSSAKGESGLIMTPSYFESLRQASTQIINELKTNNFHSLLIMSTKPGEGKTVFTNALKNELLSKGWKVTLAETLADYQAVTRDLSENEIVLLDFPGSVSSDLETLKAAASADASLLIIKNNSVLPEQAEWGLHFHNYCRAKCIGVVLNACI